MHLLSVNVGRPRSMTIGNRPRKTGIYKESVAHPVHVGELGLEHDAVVDTRHHGGPDQAVYLYAQDDYAWWREELGTAVHPGLFGDNLTLSSFGDGPLRIGDRFRIGPIVLEVTAPRIPCSTLATRMGDPAFVKRFAAARRPGAYCRVIEPGTVRAGDPVERRPAASETWPTALELFDLWYARDKDARLLERLLDAPIAIRSRKDIEHWLTSAATG